MVRQHQRWAEGDALADADHDYGVRPAVDWELRVVSMGDYDRCRRRVKKTFNEYPLITQNTQPHEIVAGADSELYFGQWNAGKIGRITLTGIVTEYVMPTPAYTYGFTLGPDNAVWFTETTANRVGRIK